MLRLALTVLLLTLLPQAVIARQSQPAPWQERLGELAIQDGGRTMPLDTYARSLAVQLTGRTRWSASSGPAAYAGRAPLELVFDLMFKGQEVLHKPLIAIENTPFKQKVGLDPQTRFFSPVQIGGCKGLEQILMEQQQQAMSAKPGAEVSRDQKRARELQQDLERIGSLIDGEPMAIVPVPAGKPFLRVGLSKCDPGTQKVQEALRAFGRAYVAGTGVDQAAEELAAAVRSAGTLDARDAKAIGVEVAYNKYRPWMATSVLYGLALVAFGVSTLMMRRPLIVAGALLTALGVGAHLSGISMRIAILGRAPVSNTYEALLWMGLIAIGAGLVAQAFNRKAWYVVGGVAVAELSVLFSNLVPLESQTNALPAVLRSNYWLIVHVLTITASYGVLAVASLLSHVYLVKEVLLKKKADAQAGEQFALMSHPLIVQTYRCMQLGLVLLTAGTILGGVWAADSWGRFWGWDPKETWALISIVVYFIILHARYLRWLRDFGMAAWTVIAFASIVWTFYGVNYLMAAGLHSYGFGEGGGSWVAVWALAEIVFVVACKLRQRALGAPAGEPTRGATTPA